VTVYYPLPDGRGSDYGSNQSSTIKPSRDRQGADNNPIFILKISVAKLPIMAYALLQALV
ncbi:TPA: hypothetical protein VAH49_002652, partial [Legionella pneumophila]|nr:hypothetical protein [Legionella pneumophila]